MGRNIMCPRFNIGNNAAIFGCDIDIVCEFVESRLYKIFEFLEFLLIFHRLVFAFFFRVVMIDHLCIVKYKTSANRKKNKAYGKRNAAFPETDFSILPTITKLLF